MKRLITALAAIVALASQSLAEDTSAAPCWSPATCRGRATTFNTRYNVAQKHHLPIPIACQGAALSLGRVGARNLAKSPRFSEPMGKKVRS